MRIKNIVYIVLILLSTQTFATSADFQDTISSATAFGSSKKTSSFMAAKQFNPQTTFDNYSSNPDQTKYYQGVKQTDVHEMANDAAISETSDAGDSIKTSINQHPRYVINQSDPSIGHSELVQSQAYNILHGITNEYIDCKAKQTCTTQFINHDCNEAPQEMFQSCKKTLKISINSHETVTHYPLSVHLSVKNHNYAGISVNAVNGNPYFIGPHDTQFTLGGRLPAGIDCKTLQGSVVSTQGNAQIDYVSFPSCSNGLTLDVHITGGHELNVQIDIASKIVTNDVVDEWVDNCTGLASDASCRLQSQTCDMPSGTQIIQGVPVTRDCFEQKFDYICRNGSGEGDCKPLQAQGCEQIGSECKENTTNGCSLYHQTYRCPQQTCSQTGDVVCGDGNDYCLEGNCTDTSYAQSKDFAQGASALSAIADAAKQFDPSTFSIFSGHPAECSEKPIGYSNCCSESGWGQDAGLDHCPEEAKELHKNRENKLAIKVGRYCSGPDPFPCAEHAEVFCIYSSKLAKILQEQGRYSQLNINFGTAKKPDCSGITVEQLQQLDLSKIDFTDFITDLNSQMKMPDIKQIQDQITEQIDQSKQSGQSNG